MFSGTRFKKITQQNDLILIAPQGILKCRNDGRKTKAYQQGIDNIAFIDQLLQEISDQYTIDESQIYAAEMSNDGSMASIIACELIDEFAAIIAV